MNGLYHLLYNLALVPKLKDYHFQAVLKQFTSGLGDSDSIVTSEFELQEPQKLEKLYISTRAGKVTQFPLVYVYVSS